MSSEKIHDYENYEFKELGRENEPVATSNFELFNFPKIEKVDSINKNQLINEFDLANKEGFEIHEDVFKLRKIKKTKEDEINEAIQKKVDSEIELIKEQAYKEGYGKGFEQGKIDSIQEEKLQTSNNIEQVQLMINNVLNKQDELFRNQEQDLYRLIRDLVKWISLKEITKDDDYLKRLFHKIVEENKDSVKICFHVGAGITASFGNAIEKINASFLEIFKGRVSIKEDLHIGKDAIEVDLGGTVLMASFEQQMSYFDELFHEVTGESNDS